MTASPCPEGQGGRLIAGTRYPDRQCGAARRHRLRSPFDVARLIPENPIRISLPRRSHCGLPMRRDSNAAQRNTTT